MHHGEFRDSRLVAVYDAECPWSRDDDFFLSVVNEKPASRVLDLGCGTGRLALGMAQAGHAVTGVDQAAASLDAARRKPGADGVVWIEGTSATLASAAFDTAVMTSHVAQFFLTDGEWADALANVYQALVPSGRLAFDSRDPDALAWERWNATDSRHEVRLPDGSIVTVWTDVVDVRSGLVSFVHHYLFPEEELLSEATLCFRTESELRASLAQAGFRIEGMYGGWERQPIGAGDGEFFVIARS
jgi:SAM-dependent methyltransferase